MSEDSTTESHPEYDLQYEPVVAWAIISNGRSVWPEPLSAAVTSPSGETPFRALAFALEDDRDGNREEVLSVVPDTTGARVVSAYINSNWTMLGYEYPNGTTPDWQAVAQAMDEELN